MQLSRRTFVTAVGGGLAAGLLGPAPASAQAAGATSLAQAAGATPLAQAAAAATSTVDDLGIPLRDVLLIGGAVGPGPDGRPVLWSAVSGEPAHLAAIDPYTGRTVSYQALDGAPGSYAVAVAPDGTVYVGAYTTGQLYRRRPGLESPIENLGRPLPSETYIWRLAVDDLGVVYGCTFPGARVFAYEPTTGHVRDYGPIVPGAQYARSIALLGDKIYAGMQPDAHLVEIDKYTGAKRELPLPAEIGTGKGVTVYDLNAYNGRVYARFGGATSGRLCVWDIERGEWTAALDNVAGLDVSKPGPGGLVYFTRNGRLTAFDPHTNAETDTGLAFVGRVVNNRGIGWVSLADPEWPGRTLVGMLWRGEMFRYNPLTGRFDLRQSDVPGEPIPLAALHVSAAGRLWVGGYLNGGVAQVDPDTGAPAFRRFAQTESVLDLGDTVWIGAYPDSRLYRYDPTKAWSSPEYSPGPAGTPDNPVKLVDLKSHDQARARALTDAGAAVAYGTMPTTTLGGALVLVDKATGTARIHRPVVTDQSVVSLTYLDGIVVGGTSVWGAYGIPAPTQTQAVLFGWDVAADAKLFEVAPVPDATDVTAVLVAGELVWGLSGGQLFAFDVARREVVRRITLASQGTGSDRLTYHAASGTFYALLGRRRLVRVDAAGTVTPVLERNADFLAAHPDGRLFLGDGPSLLRVTVTN